LPIVIFRRSTEILLVSYDFIIQLSSDEEEADPVGYI